MNKICQNEITFRECTDKNYTLNKCELREFL